MRLELTSTVEDRKYIDPMKFDILLTDFTEKEAREVSLKTFEFELDVVTSEKPAFPLIGIVWGEKSRVLVPAVVQHKNLRVKTLFLCDTGSGSTYLCERTLNRLGITDGIAEVMNLKVNGLLMPVSPSHGHFKDINLIGSSFFTYHKANIYVDYVNRMCTLDLGKVEGDYM